MSVNLLHIIILVIGKIFYNGENEDKLSQLLNEYELIVDSEEQAET